ncbi:hypothetical protein MKY84_05020 [Chryseomicrobium sp. FSL W7-1435]|uniref:hypothetical protein n=1 Tax=Chryseomicrobium sp. FSL W7-1435 TaxID=2921704 RepID=UPI00315B31A8
MKWNEYTFNELDLELVFLIRDKLKERLGEDADKALKTSGFLDRLQEDPNYVHHFEENYWVNQIVNRFQSSLVV